MRRFLENRCPGRAGDFRQRNGAGGELDGEQREACCWGMQAGVGELGDGGHGLGAGLGWAVRRAWTLAFVLLVYFTFLLSDFCTLLS